MKPAPLLLLCAVALVPGACKPTPPAAPAKPRVALIMKSLANEFFQTMQAGAIRYHDAHPEDCELIINGIKNETDLNEQVGLVEQMVAQGVQAIVIAPADSKALVPALKRAKDAGVLIVNIDNQLDADTLRQAGLAVPFVGPDNRAGARKVGEAVAAKLRPGDAVAVIEGVTTAFNGQQRTAGFLEAMKTANMNVVDTQSGEWEMDKANGIASALLTAHPDLKAVLCGNDSMALGAVAAVGAAGKTGQVLVAGFDNISAIRPMIADGRVLATADQHGEQLAVFGIEAALRFLKGGTKMEDTVTPVDLVVKP